MSTKTYVNISDSKKSSMVTIHETASPTISIKLDGANHCVWCQNLEMYIVGGRQKGYITRKKVAPVEDNPNHDEWEAKNALVKY